MPRSRVARDRASAEVPESPLAKFCRSLPHTTEDVKWGDDLVFSIGGKMYAAFDLDNQHEFAFKASEEEFWRLTQRPGIIPAPYAARFFWVKVQRRGALPMAEARRYLKDAYTLVASCLPRHMQRSLGLSEPSVGARATRKKAPRRAARAARSV